MVRPLKQRIATALVSIVCLLCIVTGANATVHDLGALSAGSTPFSDSQASSFTDTWNFSLGSIGYIYATVSATGLKGLSMDLFSETVGKKGKIKKELVITGTTFSFASLAAGDYFLRIKGSLINKSLDHSYAGSISVTPVPEPEVWAMMLIGIGLIGYQLRRKLKSGPAKNYGVLTENRTTADVLGSRIDALTWDGALSSIFHWAEARQSRYVCQCNVHGVVAAI